MLPELIQPVKLPLLRVEQVHKHGAIIQHQPVRALLIVLAQRVYARFGRVMPLVIAHTLIDVLAFVGYPLAAAWWPGVFA